MGHFRVDNNINRSNISFSKRTGRDCNMVAMAMIKRAQVSSIDNIRVAHQNNQSEKDQEAIYYERLVKHQTLLSGVWVLAGSLQIRTRIQNKKQVRSEMLLSKTLRSGLIKAFDHNHHHSKEGRIWSLPSLMVSKIRIMALQEYMGQS